MKSILFLLFVFVGCQQHRTTGDIHTWKKIKLDFKRFDNDGLSGPPDGKVAANYEFCVPMSDKYWKQVHKIDPTAQRSAGKGRVGCTEKEWLVIGSTQQPHFQRVLFDLASLPFVREIQETYYE